MLYVLLGVATAMSFVAGVECVVLVIRKKKIRKQKMKYEALEIEYRELVWELKKQMNHKDVVKEVTE